MRETAGIRRWIEESLKKQAALAGVYRAVAEKYHCFFADAGQWIAPHLLGVDFCHFTPEAHRIFAEKAAQEIKKILG